MHLLGVQVQHQAGELQGFVPCGIAAATLQGLQPGQQLAEGIGLAEVIVAAGPQSGHAVVDGRQCRQNQHRRAVVVGAQQLDDGQAVAAGQHAVGHDHVVLATECQMQAGLSLGCMIDDMAAFAQTPDQVLGGAFIVFYQQDVHVLMIIPLPDREAYDFVMLAQARVHALPQE